jgi:deoxyribodipyrimidine photo-lyase
MNQAPKTIAIWWIRRDLRLADNQALQAALRAADQVLPVFILDERLLDSDYSGEKRKQFLFASLAALDQALQQRGSRLILRRGDPIEELTRLCQESQVQRIFAEPDYSPFARLRDQKAAASLPIQWAGSPSFHPPGSVLKADGSPYTVFTPFSKAWKALPIPGSSAIAPAPEHIDTPTETVSLPYIILENSNPLEALSRSEFPAGEAAAQQRLATFTSGAHPAIYQYAAQRDRPDLDGTSRISPYLRFGLLSARQSVLTAYQALQTAPDPAARRGAEVWLNELIWREFYLHILDHFPYVRRGNFRLEGIAWRNDPAEFSAWKHGLTGYPFVDAAMRQLVSTGWMHNRPRMVVASFLTKDLLIDWRWGERYFMQHLLDGDPASNNGGWQWTAGTGTDAAPYFRIFNPVSQSIKFDPHGAYIRRWLPELSAVPLEKIHQPWLMTDPEQLSAGCRIGHDYPAPMVDHAMARERTLQAYSQAKTLPIED